MQERQDSAANVVVMSDTTITATAATTTQTMNDPLSLDFISNMSDKSLQSLVERLLRVQKNGDDDDDDDDDDDKDNDSNKNFGDGGDASVRVDRFELDLRKEMFQRIRNYVQQLQQQQQGLTALGNAWVECLHLCLHLVYFSGLAAVNGTNEATANKEEEEEAESAFQQQQQQVDRYKNITIRKQLHLLLLEDILDGLSLQDSRFFWEEHVVPVYSVLFDDGNFAENHHHHHHTTSSLAVVTKTTATKNVLWNKHTSWLPFLKLANQQLRRYYQACEWQAAAALMQTMAVIYPLSEKSAIKLWGSHNVDNVTELESADEFEQEQEQVMEDSTTTTTPAAAPAAAPAASVTGRISDYSFYESFWKLQQDFHNPYTVSVADFVKRLETFFAALESHNPVIDSAAAQDEGSNATLASSTTTTTTTTTRTTTDDHAHKYLTSSRLLTLQLQNVDFRIHVLTQFLVMANHLTSQVASLGPRLLDFQKTARQLLLQMPPIGPQHLALVEQLCNTMEPQWRRWKQNKCQPDLDAPKMKRKRIVCDSKDKKEEKTNGVASGTQIAGTKRKRPNDGIENGTSFHHQSTNALTDLHRISSRMRQVIPKLEDHLKDYVEALDPDAGIEAEYHPRNDKLCMWRAMRLLSADHLDQLEKVGPNGDLEPMVRHIYKEIKSIDIPGETPLYPPDDLDDISVDDKNEAVEDIRKEEEAVSNVNDKDEEKTPPQEPSMEDAEEGIKFHEMEIDDQLEEDTMELEVSSSPKPSEASQETEGAPKADEEESKQLAQIEAEPTNPEDKEGVQVSESTEVVGKDSSRGVEAKYKSSDVGRAPSSPPPSSSSSKPEASKDSGPSTNTARSLTPPPNATSSERKSPPRGGGDSSQEGRGGPADSRGGGGRGRSDDRRRDDGRKQSRGRGRARSRGDGPRRGSEDDRRGYSREDRRGWDEGRGRRDDRRGHDRYRR